MFVFEWLLSFAFGSLYGSLVTLIPLVAAIPYGIYQGGKRLLNHIRGGRTNGNPGTGA